MPETLDSIAVRHGSDKAWQLPGRNGHGYAIHYERFFDRFREMPIRLLEIGVDLGASHRMWSDYFNRAQLFGVDINPACRDANVGRSSVIIGDQSDPEFWKSFIISYGSEWSIIVDDGGHYSHQILTSFNCLWPHVSHGGFYCVEDLGSSYPRYTQGRIRCDEVYLADCLTRGWPNPKDFFMGKVDEINLGNEIAFAFFSKELVILQKS